MSEPVNLNRHRKRKAREEKARSAAENRVRHGLTKVERERLAQEQAREARRLAGHRREDAPDGEGERG